MTWRILEGDCYLELRAEVERLRTVLETIAGTAEGQRLFGGLIRTALAGEKRMSDFEIVRDGIGWSDDSPESEQAYAEALAALDRIEAEVERLRGIEQENEAQLRLQVEEALAEVERLRAALERHHGNDFIVRDGVCAVCEEKSVNDFETVRHWMHGWGLPGRDWSEGDVALDRIEAELAEDVGAHQRAEVERLREERDALLQQKQPGYVFVRNDEYARLTDEVERLRADLAFMSQRHESDTVEVEQARAVIQRAVEEKATQWEDESARLRAVLEKIATWRPPSRTMAENEIARAALAKEEP